jgi:hypothetical protein
VTENKRKLPATGKVSASRDTGGASGVKNPFSHLHTFSSFQNYVFRLYYASVLGHNLSMNMGMIARSLLAYRLTGSAAILGIIAISNGVPVLVFSAERLLIDFRKNTFS